MAARVNHITVRPLSEALLEYIDAKQLWTPNEFAVEALRSLSIGVLPQMYTTIIRFLLEHLDKQPADATVKKRNMVQCIQEIMPKSIVQQMAEVLSCLIRQISSKDASIDPDLAETTIAALAQIASKQADPVHRLDTIREILLEMSTPGLTHESKIHLCTAVLGVLENVKKLPADKNFPPYLIEELCLASQDSDPEVRRFLLLALLGLMDRTELLKRMNGNIRPAPAFPNSQEKHLIQIQSSILAQAQMANNLPLHIQLLYEVQAKLLEELPGVGSITTILPNLFCLQEAQRDSDQTSTSGMAQNLVLAVLAKLARERELLTLTEIGRAHV